MRGWLFAGDALIRAYLNLDPDTLCDAQWCHNVKMAVWIESRQVERIGRILAG